MLKAKLLAVLCVLFNDCEGSPTVISDFRATSADVTPVLGRGFSIASSTYHSTCLIVKEKTQPSYNYDYYFTQLLTREDVDRQLQGKIKGSFGYGFVKAKISGHMSGTSKTISTKRHIVATMRIDRYYSSIDEVSAPLSADAKLLLESSDYVSFFSACGSNYIRSIRRAQEVTAIFEFDSETLDSAQEFAAELELKIFGHNVGGGGLSVSSSASSSSESLKISIQGYGLGLNLQGSQTLVATSLNDFNGVMNFAFDSMTRTGPGDDVGMVSGIEVVPWVDNTAFHVSAKLGTQIVRAASELSNLPRAGVKCRSGQASRLLANTQTTPVVPVAPEFAKIDGVQLRRLFGAAVVTLTKNDAFSYDGATARALVIHWKDDQGIYRHKRVTPELEATALNDITRDTPDLTKTSNPSTDTGPLKLFVHGCGTGVQYQVKDVLAETITVLNGGSGYSPDDELDLPELIEGASCDTTIKVATVGSEGNVLTLQWPEGCAPGVFKSDPKSMPPRCDGMPNNFIATLDWTPEKELIVMPNEDAQGKYVTSGATVKVVAGTGTIAPPLTAVLQMNALGKVMKLRLSAGTLEDKLEWPDGDEQFDVAIELYTDGDVVRQSWCPVSGDSSDSFEVPYVSCDGQKEPDSNGLCCDIGQQQPNANGEMVCTPTEGVAMEIRRHNLMRNGEFIALLDHVLRKKQNYLFTTSECIQTLHSLPRRMDDVVLKSAEKAGYSVADEMDLTVKELRDALDPIGDFRTVAVLAQELNEFSKFYFAPCLRAIQGAKTFPAVAAEQGAIMLAPWYTLSQCLHLSCLTDNFVWLNPKMGCGPSQLLFELESKQDFPDKTRTSVVDQTFHECMKSNSNLLGECADDRNDSVVFEYDEHGQLHKWHTTPLPLGVGRDVLARMKAARGDRAPTPTSHMLVDMYCMPQFKETKPSAHEKAKQGA